MLRRIVVVILLAGLLASWPAARPSAHPHIFIDNVITWVIEDGKVVALDFKWTFDELFTLLVAQDFDSNGDGWFDAEELKELEAGAFASLKQVNFMTFLRIENQPVTFTRHEKFHAELDAYAVTYWFRLPLPEAVDHRTHDLRVSVRDETFYIDVMTAGDAVKFAGDGAEGCRAVRREDRENPIYGGLIYPEVIILSCPGV